MSDTNRDNLIELENKVFAQAKRIEELELDLMKKDAALRACYNASAGGLELKTSDKQ